MPRRAGLRRGAAALAFVALSAGTALTGAPAATAAGSAALAGQACTPTEGFSGCRLFNPDKAKQEFTVPSGVTGLDVRAWGEGGTGTSGATGGDGTSTTGGTSTDLDGGSLASTGAGGIGLLLAAAAALAVVGFAAFRLAPRLNLRSRDNA
ncbi:hypothetical protein ACFYM3_36975 [Streptomyces massasporeus]|uniref:Uncharacterized protein n=1 Tax=Streptomyces massasporeus TaxID=67324 RepID=A0ABW6LSN3_9ACTN